MHKSSGKGKKARKVAFPENPVFPKEPVFPEDPRFPEKLVFPDDAKESERDED